MQPGTVIVYWGPGYMYRKFGFLTNTQEEESVVDFRQI